jgi:hypothetical protein
MDLALTLLSIASFFALVLFWTVLPASKTEAAPMASAAPSPQAAH